MLYTHAHIWSKMGDGSAQFLWIFAICRKTEWSDNENEVNRPHLASASGKECECFVLVVELPQAILIQIENYYRQSIQHYNTANNETQHTAHCTHAQTRVKKNGIRRRRATTRNSDGNMTFNIWMLWINLWLHFANFQLTLSHYIAISLSFALSLVFLSHNFLHHIVSMRPNKQCLYLFNVQMRTHPLSTEQSSWRNTP